MSEFGLILSGAVFLVLLSFTLIWLGRSIGGAAWAWAWLFLFASALAVLSADKYPALAPAIPLFGTAFATFLLGGTILFSGRFKDPRLQFSRTLLVAGGVTAAIRMALQPFISAGASQVLGSSVIAAAVAASTFVLLRPSGRTASLWERILGFAYPAIAVVSAFNAFSWILEHPTTPTAHYCWLLVSISIGFIQVSAILTHATEHMASLRAAADRSREAQVSAAERLRALAEEASDMISEMDDRGNILYVNPAHEAILGYKPSELIGRPAADILAVQTIEGVRAEGDNVASLLPHLNIVTLADRNGRERTIECNVHVFSTETGKKRIVAISRDVTDRIATEQALEEGREELETLVEERTMALQSSLQELQRSQRLASIGTLAAGIAHQINNPIGSIQMASEFALESEGAPDERAIWRDALANGVDQAKRCGMIVSSMLQFARNEQTPKSKVDLAAILRRICSQTDQYARSQMATVDMRNIEGPLPVFGSAIELEQALLNIIRNATESSSDPVLVVVNAVRASGRAEITITDDGDGMEKEDVHHAFDPFFTTRLGRGGTGLGLSVAHGVIADHEGSLSIKSEKGVGTTVTLSVPLLETSDSL